MFTGYRRLLYPSFLLKWIGCHFRMDRASGGHFIQNLPDSEAFLQCLNFLLINGSTIQEFVPHKVNYGLFFRTPVSECSSQEVGVVLLLPH